MSDMTIVRLTDQNALLQKSMDKHEVEMMEARRSIRGLQKQLREGYSSSLEEKSTQTEEVNNIIKLFVKVNHPTFGRWRSTPKNFSSYC